MRSALCFCLLVAAMVVVAVPAAARPQYAAHAQTARTWVDRRIDALSAEAILHAPLASLVDAGRAQVADSLVAIRRPMFFCWALAQITLLFFSWRSGFAARLRDRLAQRIRSLTLVRAACTCIFTVLVTLVALPFSLVNFHLARVVGVSYEPLFEFLGDVAKATALEMLVCSIVVVGVLGLVDRFRLWYVYATLVFAAFGCIMLYASPIVVDPLFRTMTPLTEQSELGRRLYAIEHAAGLPHVPIFLTNLSRTSEVGNANVEGLGPTQRIVVGDTLLRKATQAEVAFVMAHELGHIANDDALHIALFADMLTVLALAAAVLTAERIPMHGNDDTLSRLPLVAAVAGIYSLLIFPVGNAFSNHAEARADTFALAVTHDGVAAARTFVRFADEGFSPLCPPRAVRVYFYDHPPLGSRISVATNRPDVCR